MKTLLTALAATALAAPAFAQDHADHHPAPQAPANQANQAPQGAQSAMPMAMDKMTAEQMREHCATMMGGKMQGQPTDDHAAGKPAPAPGTKGPATAEMKAMHDGCAAAMADKKR